MKNLLLALLAVLLAYPGSAEERMSAAYVLDSASKEILKIGPKGVKLGSIRLDQKVERMVLSPNGTRLVALYKGRGTWLDDQFVPQTKSMITIINTESMQALWQGKPCWSVSVGAIERGYGVGGAWHFSEEDSTFVILCEGRKLKKSGASIRKLAAPLLPILLALDTNTGAERYRLELNRDLSSWITLQNQNRIVLFSEFKSRRRRSPAFPADIKFVDPGNLVVEKEITLEGKPVSPVLADQEQNIYLLDSGHLSDKAKESVEGKLTVISTKTQKISATIPLGNAPRYSYDPVEDEYLVTAYTTSETDGSNRGTVKFIKDGQIADSFAVSHPVLHVDYYLEHSKIYLTGPASLSVINVETRDSKEIPYKSLYGFPGKIVLNADHSAGYLMVYNPVRGLFLLPVDLKLGAVGAYLETGRSGVKFGKAMAKGLAMAAVGGALTAAMPGAQGLSDIGSTAMRDASMQQMFIQLSLAVTQGGAYSRVEWGTGQRFLYAINDISWDVTVIDTENHAATHVIDGTGGARGMRFLPRSGLLAVLIDEEELVLIDPATQKKVRSQDFGGNFLLLGDDERAISISRNERAVYLLDATSLEVLERVGNVAKPLQLILNFDAASPPD